MADPLFTFASRETPVLLKEHLASSLRQAIIDGTLEPGEAIVEGRWASRLGVAQTSIREALNILTNEGFVQKESGRSAIVTRLTGEDVAAIYEVRAVLEGLAASLVAQRRPDLSELEQVIADMRAAAQRGNVEAFYRRDLNFHILVCQKSGNPFLERAVRRVVGPLFAFVVMKAHARRRTTEQLLESVEKHGQLLELLRTASPEEARQHFSESIRGFYGATTALLETGKASSGPGAV